MSSAEQIFCIQHVLPVWLGRQIKPPYMNISNSPEYSGIAWRSGHCWSELSSPELQSHPILGSWADTSTHGTPWRSVPSSVLHLPCLKVRMVIPGAATTLVKILCCKTPATKTCMSLLPEVFGREPALTKASVSFQYLYLFLYCRRTPKGCFSKIPFIWDTCPPTRCSIDALTLPACCT